MAAMVNEMVCGTTIYRLQMEAKSYENGMYHYEDIEQLLNNANIFSMNINSYQQNKGNKGVLKVQIGNWHVLTGAPALLHGIGGY